MFFFCFWLRGALPDRIFSDVVEGVMARNQGRIRMTAALAVVLAMGLGAWPVSIALRKDVRLMESDKELRPGLGARGAYGNSGSRDMGPDPNNPMKKRRD